MANRSNKGGTRGPAGLASFMRVRVDVERATKSVASIERARVPLSAHAEWATSGRILRAAENMNPGLNPKSANGPVSARQTDGREMPRALEAPGEWSGLVRRMEAVLPDRQLGEIGGKTLAGGKTPDAIARVSPSIGSIRTTIPNSIAPAEGWLSRFGALSPELSTAAALGLGNDAAATTRLRISENGYSHLVRNSRVEIQLARHLYDENSDVRLRPSEMRGGGTNTWHVTHAPQVTVVVSAGDAAHPRKIAEQMVMALQAHHRELDQKLADAWKRKAAQDERTRF